MSVLIKGMKMPTHCTECDFWHDGVFEHCLLNMEIQNGDVPLDEGEYPNACPLVEIPPHGRLIDADAEIEVWDVCGRQGVFPHSTTTVSKFLLGHLVGKIPPIIIEAEEGE